MSQKRYSSEELAEFKSLIDAKIIQASSEYELLKESISKTGDNSAGDTNWSQHKFDDGQEALSKEEMNILCQKQEKFLTALKNALIRIENKSYGICRVTGELIPKGRLFSVPHATTSIGAKIAEKG